MALSVIVFVEDVARSLAFYERVVGAELDHFDDDGSYGELKARIGFAAHEHVERHLDLSFPSERARRAAGRVRARLRGRRRRCRVRLDGVFVHITQA